VPWLQEGGQVRLVGSASIGRLQVDEGDGGKPLTVLSAVTQYILVESQEDSKSHGHVTSHTSEAPLHNKMLPTGGCPIGMRHFTLEYAVLS